MPLLDILRVRVYCHLIVSLRTAKVIAMSGYKTKAETPYYRNVKGALRTLAMSKGSISQVELAELLSVSRNTSLRRALAQAELDGLVTPFKFFGPKGGLMIGYHIHVELKQMPLQEADGMPF